MRISIGALAPAMAALFLNTAAASDIVGMASRVVDGDTLYVCDERLCEKIRLCGVNAPELKDKHGKEARAVLASIVADKQLRCIRVGEGTVCDGRSRPTNRDRIVAQCFVDTKDIAGLLVDRGYACDWIKFSGGHYSKSGEGFACD